jgi:hypothetical protein
MKNLEDWIKEINKLDKERESIDKQISKETNPLVIKALIRLKDDTIQDWWDACQEAELLLRHEKSEDKDEPEDKDKPYDFLVRW